MAAITLPKIVIKLRQSVVDLIGLIICCLACFFLTTGLLTAFNAKGNDEKLQLGLALIVAGGVLTALFICLIFAIKISRIEDRQRWLVSVTRMNYRALHALPAGNEKSIEPFQDPLLVNKWPWGSHETELLGHLEAAASKFWTLYDPGDPGSAPTNEMVATWLQMDRKVSKSKAEAIASILRADGLVTGPRR